MSSNSANENTTSGVVLPMLETPFLNDPFSIIYRAFTKLYPGIQVRFSWSSNLTDLITGEDTTFTYARVSDKMYLVTLNSTELSVDEAADTFALALAYAALDVKSEREMSAMSVEAELVMGHLLDIYEAEQAETDKDVSRVALQIADHLVDTGVLTADEVAGFGLIDPDAEPATEPAPDGEPAEDLQTAPEPNAGSSSILTPDFSTAAAGTSDCSDDDDWDAITDPEDDAAAGHAQTQRQQPMGRIINFADHRGLRSVYF